MSAQQVVHVSADLCRVERSSDEIVLVFGRCVSSDPLEAALSSDTLHRVVLSEGGAAKLQDLLVDLLHAQGVA